MTTIPVPIVATWAREYAVNNQTILISGEFAIVEGIPGEWNILIPQLGPSARPRRIEGNFVDAGGAVLADSFFTANDGGQSYPAQDAGVADPIWMVTETAAPAPIRLNGGVQIFENQDKIARLRGDAGGAVPPGAEFFRGVVEATIYACGFTGLAPDDGSGSPVGDVFLPQLLRRFARAGVGGYQAAPTFRVNNAGAGFQRFDNVVWTAPGDTGSGPLQIPLDPVGWSPDTFEPHPQVFMRQCNSVRGLAAVTDYPPGPAFETLNSVPNPMQIRQVNRTPTHSRWILAIDSQILDVILEHPAGSNLRRPRDIWNRVFGPALASRQAKGGPLPIFSEFSAFGPDRFFSQSGVLAEPSFIQCAEFVEPYDGSTDQIYSITEGIQPFVPPG